MAASTAFAHVPAISSSSFLEARHGQDLSLKRSALSSSLRSRPLHLKLRPLGGTIFSQKPCLAMAATSSEFANKESSALHEFLVEELAKYSDLVDARSRIADVCARALHNYVTTYSGGIDSKPIEDMKTALIAEELPHKQALLCAIWWLRANLRRDYEQYCS